MSPWACCWPITLCTVFLQFLGKTTYYEYTLSLSPQYFLNPDAADNWDVVIADLQTTLPVPSTAIALYCPTVTVNVPGARPVNFTTQNIGYVSLIFPNYFIFNYVANSVSLIPKPQKRMISKATLLQWISMDLATVLSHVWQ